MNIQGSSRTDAVEAFVNLLRGQGNSARILNAITDDYGGPYDAVFAKAVLLHFLESAMIRVLERAHKCLSPSGILAFTVKRGDGEGWTEAKLHAPRFFKYWQPRPLRNVVSKAGFIDVDTSEGATPNTEWLQVIAKKAEAR